MRVLIAGSSGLIGTALRSHLESQGHEVIPLVRSAPAEGERAWRPGDATLHPGVFDGIDAVINLGGVGIGDRRWTESRKQEIYDSRVGGTGLLASTMADLDRKPEVFISASGIGIYGDRGDETLTESSSPGPNDDFIVRVVTAWEGATRIAEEAGIRTVHLRSGLVLDEHGGALGRMLLPFKLGIGGRLGSGSQWWSWISLLDHVRAATHLLTSDLTGPVNLTAPEPVTNASFTDALGDVLHRPTIVPVPRIALDLILGRELAGSLAFTSARVLPERLLGDGFEFAHPAIGPALEATLQ